MDTAGACAERYYSYFAEDRPFLLSMSLEPLLGKPLVFSLNNASAKYRQVDVRRSSRAEPTNR
jgi:hypothetical protein